MKTYPNELEPVQIDDLWPIQELETKNDEQYPSSKE